MTRPVFHPRLVAERLREALADSPVVLLHGPRQCGKTTLARAVGGPRGYGYLSFDDAVVLESARADPTGFVADLPERVILDEVQRVPGLFTSLKAAVDRRRTPGRFLLTGSANILLLPTLSDSLAGRMAILRLHPLARCEVVRHPPRFLSSLFTRSFRMLPGSRLGRELAGVIVAGGYPAALARRRPRRRALWYRDYVETIIQRDARDLARLRSLETLPKLLTLAAAHTSQLLNASDLAGPFQVSRPTILDYLALLERVFLIDRLPPWHHNQLSRLVKTPKLHVGDTGVACALLGLDAEGLNADRATLGRLLETFVFQELRRQASGSGEDIRFHHFRDRDGAEVDLVLERGGRATAGVEVKASSTVTAGDFRGLRKLKEASGARFTAGVVLYDGEISTGFGEGFHAVPIRMLWEP